VNRVIPSSPFFNAHHAPIGAFASFTRGTPGASVGLSLELGRPADRNVFIALEIRDGGAFKALPFFKSDESAAEERQRYEVEQANQALPEW